MASAWGTRFGENRTMDPYSPVNRSRNGYAERKERIEMKKSYEEFQKEEFHNKKLPWRFRIVSIVVIAIAVCVTAIVLYEIHPDRERRFKVCPAEMEGKTGCTFVGSRLVVAKCVGGVWDKANAEFCYPSTCFQYRDSARCGYRREYVTCGPKILGYRRCTPKPDYSHFGSEIYVVE